jgi:membrane protein implicated in regulation of membrane protease activity
MPAWVVWVVIAVALAVGEVMTAGFVLGAIALAALLPALAAAVGLGIAAQLILFTAGTLASLFLLRPLAQRHLRMPAAIRTGTKALEGARAVVLVRVDDTGGRVRIGGEEWSARAYFDDQVIEPGTRVEVAKIDGATALVYE